MYNLEVEEAHTFFVGTQGWLVHNNSIFQCTHVVLGWAIDEEWTKLTATAKAVGGRTMKEVEGWSQLLLQMTKDKKVKFTFSLDDMDLDEAYEIKKAFENAYKNVKKWEVDGQVPHFHSDTGAYGYTEWEMYLLYRNKRLKDINFVKEEGTVTIQNPWSK